MAVMGCLVFMAVNWSILLSDTDTTHDDASYLNTYFQATEHKFETRLYNNLV